MIYINFLYFIIAVALFSTAPERANVMFSLPQDVMAILVLWWSLWHFNRYHFNRIRKNLLKGHLSLEEAKKQVNSRTNLNIMAAILLFALELYLFDLKVLIYLLPVIGKSETLVNSVGLIVFLTQLAMTWYWAYHTIGDILDMGPTPGKYILSHIKFNMAILVPWLFISFIFDILTLFDSGWLSSLLNSALFQLVLFLLFLGSMAIFAPLLITYFWDCKPLPEGGLKHEIQELCQSQGVGFRNIMSWNAMNGGLVTAGVMGLFSRFRFLLLTPSLINLLNRDEILGVVSHEIGHVKKKHLLLYFLFFIGFILLLAGFVDRLLLLFLGSSLGISLIVDSQGAVNVTAYNFLRAMTSLVFFVVYVRYVFGYFMRNFERQADAYCFEAGIDPHHLIASFMKLGFALGDDGKKSNWHHFNIAQRIDFLQRSIENPALVNSHKKKLNRNLRIFVVGLLAFMVLSFNPYTAGMTQELGDNLTVRVLEEQVLRSPGNALAHAQLGMLYFNMKKWRSAQEAYEKSLTLKYDQPEILNNLAWLFLKCPQSELLQPGRALKLAEDAIRLRQVYYIYDTLAEAYLANGKYREAVTASLNALKTTVTEHQYYKDQLEKMKKAFLENKEVTHL